VRVLALRGVGATAQASGEYGRAICALEEALSICRGLGDEEQAGRVLNQLAIAVKNSGDLASATALHEESLALRRIRGDRGGMAESLVNLGSLATAQGKWDRAEAFFAEALALEREFGDHRMIAIGLNNLGELWLRRGEVARAEPLFTEALTLGRELGEVEIIFSCLDGLARDATFHGRWRRAGRLHGAADALRRAAGFALQGDKRAVYDLALSNLRSAAGEETFTESWHEGTTMELEQVIAYALARQEPATPPSRLKRDVQFSTPFSTLSAREREVALLVSQGMTNRQIAGALTIAERTVDTHVSKILRKLQLASRVHLARWVLEH
jgi:DNA-binding CsgD family transcriptional regulator/tetratricopeptide (TPR) repeat protein